MIKRTRKNALILNLLFSQWGFIYTWKVDYMKFIVLTLFVCVGWWLILPIIATWIYSVKTVYKRKEAFYKGYK
jgi:hypothetical protein